MKSHLTFMQALALQESEGRLVSRPGLFWGKMVVNASGWWFTPIGTGTPDGDLIQQQFYAFLIPQKEIGDSKWQVCDIDVALFLLRQLEGPL